VHLTAAESPSLHPGLVKSDDGGHAGHAQLDLVPKQVTDVVHTVGNHGRPAEGDMNSG
jgi:hypothetical protein